MTRPMQINEKIFSGNLGALPEMLAWVRKELHHNHPFVSEMQRLEIAVEEALVNIISHSPLSTAIKIKISTSVLSDSSLEFFVEIFDWAPPFNPLLIADSSTASSIEKQPIGGMGLKILRTYVDHLSYKREENCNHLSFKKKIKLSSQK